MYNYVASLPGVKASSIQITSVLGSTRGSSASETSASIIQMSEVGPNNKTVVIKSAAEESPLSAAELSAASAELDKLIAQDAAEDWGSADDAEQKIGAQSSQNWMQRVSVCVCLLREVGRGGGRVAGAGSELDRGSVSVYVSVALLCLRSLLFVTLASVAHTHPASKSGLG